MVKSLLSFLLLFTIFSNFTGTYIVFKVQQAQVRRSIKRQIKSGIPEDELHYFELSQIEYDQLDWERPDIEFRHENEMFDIVRKEIVGDSIHLHCVNDKEETILFAQLDKLVLLEIEHESNQPNSPITKVVKALKLLYFNDYFDFKINPKTHLDPALALLMATKYLPVFKEVLTPPPNFS